jgi:hypothetical protein
MMTPERNARITPALLEAAIELAKKKSGSNITTVSDLPVFDCRSFCYYGKGRLVFMYNTNVNESHAVTLQVDWE